MKHSFILALILTSLLACAQTSSEKQEPKQVNAKAASQKQEKKKDPLAATITVQEVARIALLQADKMMSYAQGKNTQNLADAQKALAGAHYLYRTEKFKEAQIKAVKAKLMVEEQMFSKKNKNK